jgi:thioredoxin-like negative regulator of GroEL
VSFVKIDVDVLGSTAEEYKISSVPTFIFINDQKEVRKFSGASENDLKQGCEELEKL